MAAIEGTYVSDFLGFTLVIKNADDNTGKCDAELFYNGDQQPSVTYQVVAAHYHFQNGDMGWGATTLLGLLAVGPADSQEHPFRAIVFRAENKDFKSFSGYEVLVGFGTDDGIQEVYTRVESPN